MTEWVTVLEVWYEADTERDAVAKAAELKLMLSNEDDVLLVEVQFPEECE